MSTLARKLPPDVRSYVGEFVARKRAVRLLRSFGMAAAAGLGWALSVCLLDRVAPLRSPLRTTAFLTELLLVGGILARGISRALRRTDWLDAAAQIECLTPAFGERLQTVTSQLLGPASYRGSDQLLRQMLDDVAARTALGEAARLVPWKLWALPWLVAVAVLGVAALLWPLQELDLPRLVDRFVHPLARLAPVAVARIDIEPKDMEVAQGESVTVAVSVSRTDGRAPVLYLSNDGKSWSHVAMNPVAESPAPKPVPVPASRATTQAAAPGRDERYFFPLDAVGRDLQYYVEAGDAKTEVYQIRTKRVPAAAEFHIRFTLPAYTARPPVVVSNVDGRIESVVGSTAEVTVVATEPLSGAELVLGDGSRVATSATGKPSERVALIDLRRDSPYRLEMTSVAGVTGLGPAGSVIHAVPDRAPQVKILQPPDDIRLDPFDEINLRYEAIDDYGIASLEAQVQINSRPAAVFPVAPAGPAARREGEFGFNLADLDPHVGDVVTFGFRAGDAAGHNTTSDVLRVLVTPTSVGVKALGRAAEVKRAAGLATSWAAAVQKAKAALDAARGGDPRSPKPEPWNKAGHALADAAEASAVLRQALLRSVARSESPALSTALARLLDDVAAPLVEPGRALTPAARADEPLAQRLSAAVGRSKEVAARLATLADGERAQLALAEYGNLKAVGAAPQADRAAAVLRARAAEHARRSRDALLRELNLVATGGDVVARLQQLIDRERDWVNAQRPVDFAPVAQEWAQRLRQTSGGSATSEFSGRLVAAAEAEAVRADADFVVARDLQLAARAATALHAALAQKREERIRDGRPPETAAATQAYVQAFLGVARQHDAARHLDPQRPPDADPAIRAAAEARSRLAAYAAQYDAAPTTAPAAASTADEWSPEELAFDAAAETTRRRYERAALRDARLADELGKSSPEEASRFTDDVKAWLSMVARLDELAARQQLLRRETETAAMMGDESAFGAIAAEQQELAETIAVLARAGDGPATQPAGESREMAFAAPSARETRRNPSAAAAWDARAATEALYRDPPEPRPALAAQQSTVDQLRLAWQRAAGRAARQRLETLPAFATIFQPSAAETSESAGLLAFGNWLRGSRAREWPAASDPRGGRDSRAGDAEAAGYSDQLKAYFDAVARARDDRGKK